jgi:hypothetical protein
VKEVSTKRDDDKKAMLTVTHDNIGISSDMESSFESE